MHPLLSWTKRAAVSKYRRFVGSKNTPPVGSVILCRSSDSYVQTISVNAHTLPSQSGLPRPVTCFRRKSCAPYLQHELRAYKLPGRVQGSNLIPLFSEQEYVSRRNGVAYLPQKPEQYSIAARENLAEYMIPFLISLSILKYRRGPL